MSRRHKCVMMLAGGVVLLFAAFGFYLWLMRPVTVLSVDYPAGGKLDILYITDRTPDRDFGFRGEGGLAYHVRSKAGSFRGWLAEPPSYDQLVDVKLSSEVLGPDTILILDHGIAGTDRERWIIRRDGTVEDLLPTKEKGGDAEGDGHGLHGENPGVSAEGDLGIDADLVGE